MNYEDGTDRLRPEEVVSEALLRRLREAEDVIALTAESVRDQGSASASSAAYEAIRLKVREDTGPDEGAPPEAAAMEEDAMLCGYRLGMLALGRPVTASTRAVSPRDLIDRADSMYLYAIPLAGAAPVAEIAARHVQVPTGAHEEATAWAWAFGLGVAVVEADLLSRD